MNGCAGNWRVEMCLAIRNLPVYGRAFQDVYMIHIDIVYNVGRMKFYIMYSQSFYIINFFLYQNRIIYIIYIIDIITMVMNL